MKITLSNPSEGGIFRFIYPPFVLEELFSVAKELHFDGVDYCLTIPDLFSRPERVLKLSKEYDIPILDVHAPMHLLIYTPSFFFPKLIKMTTLFSDCKVFNFHLSGFIIPLQKNDENLRKFLALAKKYHMQLSFESNPRLLGLHYYPKVTYDPEHFAQYCIANNLPITFDTAHIAHWNYDIVTFFKKYHKQIKLIHLSDSIGSIQHLPLGKGNLPIKKLLQEIKKNGYNESLTFEINHFPKDITIKEKTIEIQKSLTMVRQYAL